MEVCEEYIALESQVDERLAADGMNDSAFNDLWIARMRKIPDMNKEFHRLMRSDPPPTLPDGLGIDEEELRAVTAWIANQFSCAFAKKIAMGERYEQAGYRRHLNTGYQMGSSLVEIINQRALAKLSKIRTVDKETLMFSAPLGDERALPYLARIARNITSAGKVLNPNENLIEQYILKIEPQPTNMRPEDRKPDSLVRAVGRQPLTAAHWASPSLQASIARIQALRGCNKALPFEEQWRMVEDAAARYQGI